VLASNVVYGADMIREEKPDLCGTRNREVNVYPAPMSSTTSKPRGH